MRKTGVFNAVHKVIGGKIATPQRKLFANFGGTMICVSDVAFLDTLLEIVDVFQTAGG